MGWEEGKGESGWPGSSNEKGKNAFTWRNKLYYKFVLNNRFTDTWNIMRMIWCLSTRNMLLCVWSWNQESDMDGSDREWEVLTTNKTSLNWNCPTFYHQEEIFPRKIRYITIMVYHCRKQRSWLQRLSQDVLVWYWSETTSIGLLKQTDG